LSKRCWTFADPSAMPQILAERAGNREPLAATTSAAS
jgi:hypothetical protein